MGLHVRVEFDEGAVSELEGPDVAVVRVELWQAMSELFDLVVRLRAPTAQLDTSAVAGKHVVVHLDREDGDGVPERFLPRVAGLVRRATQLVAGGPGELSTYELAVAPPHHLLGLHRGQHIQQHKTAPEMLARVVKYHNEQGSRPIADAIDATHGARRREYTVQYGERHLDFVRRVLAEDGIAFYYAGEGLADLRLVSSTSADRGAATQIALPYRPKSDALRGPEDAVLAIEHGPRLRTTRQLVRDYHFDNPRFHPSAQAATEPLASEVSGSVVYEEGALHAFDAATDTNSLLDGAPLDAVATRRLEGERRDHAAVTCRTTCPLPVGAVLTVTGEHPLADAELTVVGAASILEYAEDAGGGRVTRLHRVSCIPARLDFRPRRLPKPRIHGMQRATVVGSEHIDVDEHGRVLLAFYWDLYGDRITDPRAAPLRLTRRVAVSQSWAGPGHGFLAVPRAGDEVLIAYIDGDPDEPVVVGRLYNGHNPAQVGLPADRTQSLWRTQSSPEATGFHEIRFEDANGREELHVEAERLYTRKVKGSESTSVGGSRSLTVGEDQSLRIGGDFATTVDGNIHEKCNRSRLDTNTTIIDTRQRFDNSRAHKVLTSSLDFNVYGPFVVEAQSVSIESPKITLKAGGSSIEIVDGCITIKAGSVKLVSG
ncbi:MAG: type VI secretion system tip protein VgrG [Myxococcales bacterium]|nr:type VI secretion system tip protein VgrG [Myxococcales bacterium]